MGDLIPLLVERATGINISQALATLATGETPDLTTSCTVGRATSRSMRWRCSRSTTAGAGGGLLV